MDADITPVRVEELWFSDSGLIVQVEQYLFRVSGAVLAARSPVFRDMLSFPKPPDAETIDGCPVVRLPDSAADVTYFFLAIFDSSFFENYPSSVTFKSVLSILRLSNKYAVDYLLRRALMHLSHDFPTTLSAFEAEDTECSTDMESLADIDPISPYVAAVQIAREVNAPWILPVAFYELAAIGDAAIDNVLDCNAYPQSHPAASKLSDADQILFLKSSMHISRQATDVVRFLCHPDTISGCSGRGQTCLKARMRAMAQVQEYLSTSHQTDPNPLEICDDADIWSPLRDGCCKHCYNFCTAAYQEARQALWDKLPSFCGLPPWPELEKMKATALEI